MKTLPSLLMALAGLVAFLTPAHAQDTPRPGGGNGPGGGGGRGGEWRERMLKEFDKDGDGKLSETEQKAAREAGEKRMLEQFDADKDGKLSDEERAKARESFGRGQGGPGGPGGMRRGPLDRKPLKNMTRTAMGN